MADVVEANEISLGGVMFPTRGPIRYANISVVPNPVILGDVSRASDTQIMSQLVLPDGSEGMGIDRGDARTDQKRSWTSEAETRFRHQITLPNKITDLGAPASETAAPSFILDYLGTTYVIFGAKVYTLVGTTWSLQYTLPAPATGAVVYEERLWITTLANGMHFKENPNALAGGLFVPGSWNVVAENSASLLWASGEQLYRWIHVYVTSGANQGVYFWENHGYTFPWVPDIATPGSPSTPSPWQIHVHSGLFIDVFAAIMMVPQGSSAQGTYYIATDGVYFNTALGLVRTAVNYGLLQPGRFGRTAAQYKADIVIPTGELGLLAYRPSPSTTDVRYVGLDQEDGVPASRWGVIEQLAAGQDYLYALVTHRGLNDSTPRDLGVYAWDGSHWHHVASTASGLMVTPGTNVQGKVLSILPDGLYIGYVKADGNPAVKRIDERPRPVTPKQVGTDANQTRFSFAAGPVDHTTPWFDLGSPIQQKLLTRLELWCSGMSLTETVTVSYATDLDDSKWTTLTPINQNGLTIVRLNGAVGLVANFVRFKYTLRRQTGDANAYKRPLIEFAVLHWARLLPAQYGFSAEIDLTKRWKGKTPLQLAREVERLSDPEQTPQLVPFTYEEDLSGERRTRFVKVSRMTGTSESGRKLVAQGSVFISLMAPYADDNV